MYMGTRAPHPKNFYGECVITSIITCKLINVGRDSYM